MKWIARILVLLISAALLYTTAMYGYVWLKMRPLTPIAPISAIASAATRPAVVMLHAVNSVQRAQAKDASYEGLEIDLNRVNGRMMVAHDEGNFTHAAELSAIFSALKNPEQKTWWIDLKTDLTQQDIDELKTLASHYKISPRRMLFEVTAGPTAQLLSKNGFPILLAVTDGFHEDGGKTQKRAELNARQEELLRQYQPYAIAASIGKYPYLKAYFPHYNKAIYSSTTVRPSLKKYFLQKAMLTDPSLRVWMKDEYTSLPF